VRLDRDLPDVAGCAQSRPVGRTPLVEQQPLKGSLVVALAR
jgi:hypothetical protein